MTPPDLAHLDALRRPAADSPMYYFGCVGRPGHFFHGPDLRPVDEEPRDYPPSIRCANFPGGKLDGTFCDKQNRTQGRARVFHVEGWTILAFWDYSIDKRGGSNSVFLIRGTWDFGVDAADGAGALPTGAGALQLRSLRRLAAGAGE